MVKGDPNFVEFKNFGYFLEVYKIGPHKLDLLNYIELENKHNFDTINVIVVAVLR